MKAHSLRTLRQKGFSLVEVMIAIVIIVIGLAGVTAALVYGVKNSTRGKDISESSQLARTIIEYTQGTELVDTVGMDQDQDWPEEESGINDSEETRRPLNASPYGDLPFTPQQVERYQRNISVERLSEDPSSHLFRLARITVRVSWQDSQGEHNSELVGVIRHARI